MRGRTFHPERVRSILVMRLYFLGDVVLATPVLEALRRRFPDARLTVLVKQRAVDVLVGNPNVDEIVVYDAVPNYHMPHRQLNLARRLRRAKFDLAVDLSGNLLSSWLLWAADPGYRVGFNHAGFPHLLDRRIPYVTDGSVVEHLLSAVEPLGAKAEPLPRIYLSDVEREESTDALRSAGIDRHESFAVLAPGANWEYRRWPAERHAELARRLGAEACVRVLLTGGPEDRELCASIAAASGGSAQSLAGDLGIRGFAATVERAEVFIGSDSGPMHIAAAVGTPVVALFGPNTPDRFAPRGSASVVIHHRYPCSPCDQKRCVRPEDPCMKAITVTEVLDAALALMAERRSGGGRDD
jgi:lipopolysaccharide heptosyltransferase II